MHGQYIRSLDKQLISEENTFPWLWRGDLKAETESKLRALQDQVYKRTIMQQEYLQTGTHSK